MTNSADAGSWKKYARLGLIPALVAVLLAVIFWPSANPPASSEQQPETTTAIPPKKARLPVDISPKSAVRASFGLDDALALNIFNPLSQEQAKLPEGIVAPTKGLASVDEAPRELASSQVQAIFKNAAGRVAIIDSRIVHVGDSIAAGRVVEITDDNVFIAPE